MVCSVSAGKSGPNWLERLRSSRGFPSGDASNLENFLNNPTSPDLKQPDPIPDHNPDPNPSQNDQGFDRIQKEDNQLFDVMTNVLFDLFNYGDSNNGNFAKIKKPCRKQSNPRIYIPSNNDINENINVHSEKESRSDNDNSQVAGVKESSENLVLRRNEEEGDTSKGNLSGFSLTEVTVIDTSYKSWKFEKLLYRKKNVWKVRDKKGSSVNVGNKKKRKQSASFLDGEKKQKVVDKEASGREREFELNEVSYQTNKSVEGHERALDTAGKILKKKEANLKSAKGSTPVILIKSIPPRVGSHLGCKLVASERLENEHKSGACKLLRELRNSLLCLIFK
ncbi:Hypothetical predicted protein [Olea europaea subsp. europaea]|uniref:Uncharacterized protein n=1 Tax=Olea europaea subsp. europaea TaxID=158383 RepID=A0A8S0RP33_OLEEU|nr:Hypothetical predicted protein [Olea europaea subsp. europaea]